MTSNNLTMVPVLTTPAGCCLTGENWQATGIKTASFYLSALLMKPGFENLKTLSNLATYVGWQDKLVLNAALSKRDSEGRYLLRSEYDGSRSAYTLQDILMLLTRLEPDVVLLPEGVSDNSSIHWQALPEKIFLFLSIADLPKIDDNTRPYGVYIDYDAMGSFSELLDALNRYRGIPCYIMGSLSLSLMRSLCDEGVRYVESNIPASDGCVGDVYHSQGIISLKSCDHAHQFEVIDSTCQCPVCQQKLTRAYLHHLLEHTPLLAQRYLVQHNMYYSHAALNKVNASG